MTTVGIIGGTGPQGKGLGYRFARGGYDVVLGSRQEDRAVAAAEELGGRLGGHAAVRGMENDKAARTADLAVLAIPFSGHDQLVDSLRDSLAGKTVISCVNPLGFDRHGPYGLDLEGSSAAERAAALLPESDLVAAFHHLSAVTLLGDSEWLAEEDVLVCGDSIEAKNIVIQLASTITGKDGIDAGRLRLARQLEPLTAILISINKRYKVHSGVAVVGMPTGR